MNRGFSLPEVLVSLAIGVVASVLLLSIMVENYGVFYKQSSRVDQGVGLNEVLAKIRQFIKEADSVAVSYIDGPTTYTSSSTELVLKLPSIDSGGNKIFNVFDHIVYFTDTDKLKLKVILGVGSTREIIDKVIAFNVDTVNFEYFDPTGTSVTPTSATKVKFTLTLKQKAGNSFETNTLTTEANLRNN